MNVDLHSFINKHLGIKCLYFMNYLNFHYYKHAQNVNKNYVNIKICIEIKILYINVLLRERKIK